MWLGVRCLDKRKRSSSVGEESRLHSSRSRRGFECYGRFSTVGLLLLVPLTGPGPTLGEKSVIHGIDFRLGPMDDCEPRGGLSHESFTPAP
jgi:hypothetical protein